MKIRFALTAGALLLLTASAAFTQASAELSVGGPGRQISYDPHLCPLSSPHCELDTETESHLAVNPDDPLNAVAVFQQGRNPFGGAIAAGYATTVDGGRTWTAGSAPGLTEAVTGRPPGTNAPPWHQASDPAVAFDAKHGVVLFQTLGVACPTGLCGGVGVTVNRSTDGGRTFGPPVVVFAGSSDKNWIAVDNFPSSPFYGRAYSVWGPPGIVVSHSDDGGLTWSAPRPAANDSWGIPMVGPDGTVYLLGSSALSFSVSTDGGLTWTRRRRAGSPVFAAAVLGYETTSGLRAGNFPSAVVDPESGDIYVVWQDLEAIPLNHVVLVRSRDKGFTWDAPVDVTPDAPPGVDHFTPTVAAWGGHVFVTYRTHVAGPAAAIGMEMRSSRDGGVTFSAPTDLAPLPSLLPFAAWTYTGFFYGEYMGLGAGPGKVYAAWPQSGPFFDPPIPSTTHQRMFGAAVDFEM